MKTLTKEQINKLPLDKYIFWLNSMTTPELHEQFPGEFHVLKASDNQNESVTNLLANDAILWKFVKTHAQKLASELTEKESGGKTVEETRKMDKETQCNNIIKKIKETWTPDNRTFEEAELDAKGRKTAGEISKIADEYSELAIKEYPTEIKEGMALHYARGYMACQIELSQFQQPEITNEMIAIYFNNHSDNFIWDGKARKPVQTRSEVIETIRWALSLKVQPERGEQHNTCDGCQMFQDCGCMLDDSCPECVDHHLWTPKEQPSDEDKYPEWKKMCKNCIHWHGIDRGEGFVKIKGRCDKKHQEKWADDLCSDFDK